MHGSDARDFAFFDFPDELIIGGLPIVIERTRAALRET
jgi:hypothetical protein